MNNFLKRVPVPYLVVAGFVIVSAAIIFGGPLLGKSALFIVLALLGLAAYFLPSIIGSKRHNAAAIFVLNLFLGWTLVGWVVALVWAVSRERST